jgi:hypothetical protein
LGTAGRHARVTLGVLVVAMLGANVAVIAQRDSGSAAVLTTRAAVGPTTTRAPGTDAGPVVTAAPEPIATPVTAAHAVPTAPQPRHVGSDERPGRNIPDNAPKPKPAAVTGPIVGMLDGPDIEGYARYEPQTTCDPTPKPGTVALRNLLLSRYPNTQSFGISRACDVGGVSEHKEGRAFDWGANVNSAAQRASVDSFLAALFATDSYGHKDALARRLGVMYVIWNQQIWGAYNADAGWRPYSGDSPHTDHVHISLSWAGARAETSYYSGHVVSGLPDGSGGPTRRPTPTTTKPSTRPPTRPSTTTTTRPPRSTTTRPPSSTTTTQGSNNGVLGAPSHPVRQQVSRFQKCVLCAECVDR